MNLLPGVSPPPARRSGEPETASPATRLRQLAIYVVALSTVVCSCGKKGPPLVPYPTVPRPVADLNARRMGSDVYLRFTIPRANVDGRQPADIQRVDVYGMTARQATADEILEYGTLIAQVPVRKPPPPPEPVDEGEPLPSEPPSGPGLDQGSTAIVIDSLTPDRFLPVVTEAEEERLKRLADLPGPPKGPLLSPAPGEGLARRWYVTVGINHRGRKGPPSARTPVLLIDPPPPPAAPTVTYTADAFTVTWVVPSGAREIAQEPVAVPLGTVPGAGSAGVPDGAVRGLTPPTQSETDSPMGSSAPAQAMPADHPPPPAPAAAPNPAPADEPSPDTNANAASSSALPRSGGTLVGETAAGSSEPGVLPARPLFMAFPASVYNVYDVSPREPSTTSEEPAAEASEATGQIEQPITPVPLNSQPIPGVTFTDRRMAFGSRRCYSVRTMNIFGPVRIESEASEPTCVEPSDTFPPTAPRGLAAVGTEGAINLIWEANSEADLDGYLVLRGEAPGATLQALFGTPIKETTYRDTSTKPGVQYVYAIVAVDRSKPANVSQQSNRVEEAAR